MNEDEPLTITLNDDDDDEQKTEVEIIEVKPKSWRSKARKISSSHFYNVTLNPSLPLGKGEKQLSKPNSAFEEEVSRLLLASAPSDSTTIRKSRRIKA